MFSKLITIFLSVLIFGCSNSVFSGKSGKHSSSEANGDNSNPQNQSGEKNGEDADGADDSNEISEGDDGSITEHFSFSATKALDVLFTLDTSPSMAEELESLANNFKVFIDEVKKFGIDVNVIVSYKNFAKLDEISSMFKHDNRKVNSHDSICRMHDFFASENAKWLREGAPLDIFVVSDDDAKDDNYPVPFIEESCRADEFKAPEGKKTTFNGIIGLKQGVNTPTCKIMNVGKDYQSLASQYKGQIYDLCTQDWTTLVKSAAGEIGQRIRKFKLKHQPDLGRDFKILVNDKELKKEEYTYDEASNTFTVPSSVVSAETDKVVVTYFPK